MLARSHPTQGWLKLKPADWGRSLEALLNERDKLADPTHSGPAPNYYKWVAEVEMPRLRQSGDPFYVRQFEAHDETT